MTDLEVLGRTFGTDKYQHGYLPHYDHHLGHLRHQPDVRICEIGVQGGRSLRMWGAWLGPATILGVEIDPAAAYQEPPRVSTVVADVKDWTPTGDFNLIIDDGSHQPADVGIALDRLWPQVRPGGWYVIEDLAMQFTPEPTTAALVLLTRICSLMAEQGGDLAAVHIYPQIVFLAKLPADGRALDGAA